MVPPPPNPSQPPTTKANLSADVRWKAGYVTQTPTMGRVHILDIRSSSLLNIDPLESSHYDHSVSGPDFNQGLTAT